jgi:regulatory protein
MAGIVTGISVQKRNPNRLNIEINGSFGFGLDRMVAAWLQIGQQLNDEQIAELVTKDTQEVLYQAALRLISWRYRSKKELVQRLMRKGYELQNIDIVIERLTAAGLLDDEKFAQNWVTDRSEFHPRSKRLLSVEMLQKGITPEVITGAIKSVSSDEDLARAAGRKVIRRWQGLGQQEFSKKCSDYLARRGFGYSLIRTVIPVLWSELQDLK